MPDQAPYLKAAISRRNELSAEAEALKNKLAVNQDELKKIEAFIDLFPVIQARVLADETGSSTDLPLKSARPSVIVGMVVELLQQHEYLQTRDILAELRDRGITIEGQNPIQRLSQIVSNEKALFTADRSKGWSLKTKNKGEASSGNSTADFVAHAS